MNSSESIQVIYKPVVEAQVEYSMQHRFLIIAHQGTAYYSFMASVQIGNRHGPAWIKVLLVHKSGNDHGPETI